MAKDDKKTPGTDPVKVDPPVPPETAHPIEPVLTAEQQADIARLASSIAETEKPPGADLEVQPVVPVPAGSFRDDAAMCVDVFVESAIAYCPAVEKLWPSDKREKVATALGRVFQKYNFSFARFGPEIALIAVAGPALWQTSKVIAQQMNNQAAVPEQARAPVPSGDPLSKAPPLPQAL